MQLREATYAACTVESAHHVKEQWNSISGTLAKAGFVAKTPGDLGRSIEKLLKFREQAVASPNKALLDKTVLASEKAAMIKDLQGQYNKEREQMVKDLTETFNNEVATQVNTELNKHRHENLNDEAAAKAAPEIESAKDYATKLQEQLEQAQEAITEAEGKRRSAEETVRQKNLEITTLVQSGRAEITGRDDQIQALNVQITHMQKIATTEAMTSAASKTASGNLEQQLAQACSRVSEVETALNSANEEIARIRAEGQQMFAEGQRLQSERNKFEKDLETARKTVQMREEEGQGLEMQMRKINDQTEKVKAEKTELNKRLEDLRENAKQQTPSNTAAGQQIDNNDAEANASAATPQQYNELDELEAAFDYKVAGVDPFELSEIIIANCKEVTDSTEVVKLKELPAHVLQALFAYMHENKTKRKIAKPRSRRQQETSTSDNIDPTLR